MADRSTQTRRRRLIAQLVSNRPIKNQYDLRAALLQHEVAVTQSTLSRDLQSLGINRRTTEQGYRYHLAGASIEPAPSHQGGQRTIKRLATLEAIGVNCNQHLVVVHTLTGRASGVGVYLDSLKIPDVLGSVAGDDTLLVIPKSIENTKKLRNEIASILQLD